MGITTSTYHTFWACTDAVRGVVQVHRKSTLSYDSCVRPHSAAWDL